MFLAPCAIGALLVAPFAVRLDDRRLAPADRPAWSLREFLSTFYVDPRRNPDFTWAFASRFLFVMAYAFLVTYQAYFLLERIGSDEDDVPRQIFLSTLVQSAVVVVASLVGGRLSDRTGRRKVFVLARLDGLRPGAAGDRRRHATSTAFLVGMALAGLGFGVYVAVDLALVADVLPDESSTRQGPRRVQHGRRPPVLGGAGPRAVRPEPRRRQLRRAVRRRRGLRAARGAGDPAGQARAMSRALTTSCDHALTTRVPSLRT